MKRLVTGLSTAVLLLLPLAGELHAIDFSPETRRKMDSYRRGLDRMATDGGLAQLLGQPAFGEGGQLVSASEVRGRLTQETRTLRAETSGGILGMGGEGMGRGEGPPAAGEGGGGPTGEGAGQGPKKTRTQILAGKVRQHVGGFTQFSGVLASYVGVQLLIEIDKGNMEAKDFWPEMYKMVLSPQAVAGYMSFVGVHGVAERILKAGTRWGAQVPEAAALHRAATNLAKLKALQRLFLKQGILLTAVAGVIETSIHWWKKIEQRPWEKDNPEAALMKQKGLVGSFLHSLTQEGNTLKTLGYVFTAFGEAVVEVDWLGLAITSAAFVAGMVVTAWAPGWVQLAVGFILADLAHKYLVPWIKRQITSRMNRIAAANQVRMAHMTLAGFSYGHRRDPIGGLNGTQLTQRRNQVERVVSAVEDAVPEAFDAELEPIRKEYEEKYQELSWAAQGKLSSDLTNEMTHAWVFRRAQWNQITQLPGVVGSAADAAFEAARTYSARAEAQMSSLKGAFSGRSENLKPMADHWENYVSDLRASDEGALFDVTQTYISRMRRYYADHSGGSTIRREGADRLLHVTVTRYLSLEVKRRKVAEDDGDLRDFNRNAQATVYRAARTRAREIRNRLRQLDLARLEREGRPLVRPTVAYPGMFAPPPSDPLGGHLATIRRFLGERRDQKNEFRDQVASARRSRDQWKQSHSRQLQDAVKFVRESRAEGEKFGTLAPLIASLIHRGALSSSDALVKESVEVIQRALARFPDREKEVLGYYNSLLTVLTLKFPEVVPVELQRLFKKHGLRPKLPADLHARSNLGVPGGNNWPWPTGREMSVAERAMAMFWYIENSAQKVWSSAREYDELEEKLQLLEIQDQGITTYRTGSSGRGENVIRARASEADGLIRELKQAEGVIDQLSWLEKHRISGLDQPAWIVPHFDRDKPDYDEKIDRATSQENEMRRLIEEYEELFAESAQVLSRVYAAAPSAYPAWRRPDTGQPAQPSGLTDQEAAQLRDWLEKLKKQPASGTSTLRSPPSRSDELFGFGSLGAPKRNEPPRTDLNLGDVRRVSHDHQAYQPLLSYMVQQDKDLLPYDLVWREGQLSPKRSPESVYRQTDVDRERERQDKMDRGLRDPALGNPILLNRGMSTIRCHGNNQNCEPPEPRYTLSNLDFERAYQNDPTRHADEAWFVELPNGLRDAWSRWWRMKQILDQLDRLEAAYERNRAQVNPMRQRLFPEATRQIVELPPVLR